MVRVLMRQVTLWDSKVFYLVFGKLGQKTWKRFFYALSKSADALACVLAGLILWMLAPRTAPYVAAGLLAFGFELSLYYLIKKGIRRPRPFKTLEGVHFLIMPPDEFSFPSGHTAAAFLMASILTAACPWLLLPALAWATLVGFSRVYLGVHYPSDVLAGMVLGLLCAQAGLFAFHLG